VGAIAARGRELEGGPAGRLRHLAAFRERLAADRLVEPFEAAEYRRAARRALDRVHFTGRLEHEDLPALLPACSAQVVPSTFPEAFGMVAAEAACCGALPVSAAHSGLAEVTAALAPAVNDSIADLLSFPVDDHAVEALASRLVGWLTLAAEERRDAAGSLAAAARGRFGWEGVARGVIAAAGGRLDELPAPAQIEAVGDGVARPPSG
jgi:glycosyltransferase involved in cell wall biosynthesis